MSKRSKSLVTTPAWRRRAIKLFAYSLIFVVMATAFFTAGTDFARNGQEIEAGSNGVPEHILGRKVLDEPFIYAAGPIACMSLGNHNKELTQLSNPRPGEHLFSRLEELPSDNVPADWSLMAVVNLPEILCIARDEHFQKDGLRGADDSDTEPSGQIG